jgi:hypothetical protein
MGGKLISYQARVSGIHRKPLNEATRGIEVLDMKPCLGGFVAGKRKMNRHGELVRIVGVSGNNKEFPIQVERLEFKYEGALIESGENLYDVSLDGLYWSDGRITPLDIELSLDEIPKTPTLVRPKMPVFTIGADPEIMLRGKQGVIAACSIVSEMDAHHNAYGSYGRDGCDQILELRPKAATTPYMLVKNIQKVIELACSKNRHLLNHAWMAGSFKEDWGIGGHIHFGVRQRPFMVPMLDHFLAGFVTLIESKEEAIARRGKKGYGKMGDFRHQDWGFEYRTLSSWIASPCVALAVLSLAKHIMNQFEIEDNHIFQDGSLRTYLELDIHKIHMSHDTEFFYNVYELMWPMVRSWPTEKNLVKGLDMFELLVKSGYKIDDRNILKSWGIKNA